MQVHSTSKGTAPLILFSPLDTDVQHQLLADLPLERAQYLFLSKGSLGFRICLNGYGGDKNFYLHRDSKLETSRL
jgi:hypothetical protein